MPSKKSKKSTTPRKLLALPDVLEKEVAQASSWPAVIRAIRRFCNIPDLSTKSGLKECHKKIEDVFAALNDVFDQASSRVKAGVIGIWGEMAFDDILCWKLGPAGTIPRLLSVLDTKETRILAIQVLCTMTRCIDANIHLAVAKEATPAVVTILHANLGDAGLASDCICLLSHLGSNIYLDKQPIFRQYPSINDGSLLLAVLDGLAHGPNYHDNFTHGHGLIVSSSLHAHSTLEEHPILLDFIVASLRVPDMKDRLKSLQSLWKYKIHHHKPKNAVSLDRYERATRLMKLPLHLQALAVGSDHKSDIWNIRVAKAVLHDAQLKAAKSRDFVQLGRAIGELVLMNEYFAFSELIEVENKQHLDATLPYKDYIGSLPIAANALRDHDYSKYCDVADIIEILYFMCMKEFDQVRRKSEAAMQRNSHAFLYYARAIADEDCASGLEWANQGLQLKNVTPSLRIYLLPFIVSTTMNVLYKKLHWKNTSCNCWQDAQTLLQKAAKLSKEFVKQASLDNRELSEMCAIALVTTIVIKGGSLSQDMAELEELKAKLKQAEEIFAISSNTTTLWQGVYDLIVERYKNAANSWDGRFEVFFCKSCRALQRGDPHDKTPLSLKERPTEVDHFMTPSEQHNHHSETLSTPIMEGRAAKLHKCDHCKHASAGLKRCGRCGIARYCNENCQRMDWKRHKSECVAKASA